MKKLRKKLVLVLVVRSEVVWFLAADDEGGSGVVSNVLDSSEMRGSPVKARDGETLDTRDSKVL